MARGRAVAYRGPSHAAVGRVAAMELAVPLIDRSGPGGLIMHTNEVHSVKTIDGVARELDESVDWLFDIADEMDTEDGVIWVYGVSDDGVMAFTEFGTDRLARSTA